MSVPLFIFLKLTLLSKLQTNFGKSKKKKLLQALFVAFYHTNELTSVGSS